jgi:hypothetical protein
VIGVACKPDQRPAVEEFFQLFKTPWEFHAPGRAYEVVISTLDELPEAGPALTIVYSSAAVALDALEGVSVGPAASRHLVPERRTQPDDAYLPIYGAAACFRDAGRAVLLGCANAEVTGLALSRPGGQVLRIGYDLFDEIAFLLSEGQPVEHAAVPALDRHIALLREWITAAGLPLVEIPPVPWGHAFIACLTHDVDFAGIRRHRLDHTLWGFVYRASLGSLRGFIRGTTPLDRLAQNWLAVLSLPLVYAGLRADFWERFDRYVEVEAGRPSTFFLIPFKHRAGERVEGPLSARRATPYDVGDVPEQVQNLLRHGAEIGLHGIDAWHSTERGREELRRVAGATGQEIGGIRMHWLCFDRASPAILDRAGFDYDATCGYNEAVGYRAGTAQVFKPLAATRLLELPLHIQDTALFFPGRLGLTDAQAWQRCAALLDTAGRGGGVLTVSWHERSLVPERLWGAFYSRLLREIDGRGAWFASAGEAVRWFRARRAVTFEDAEVAGNSLRLRLKDAGAAFEPCLTLRVHRPRNPEADETGVKPAYTDFPYPGGSSMEVPLD